MKHESKRKIIFLFNAMLSFVEKDLHVLGERYDVMSVKCTTARDSFMQLRLVKDADVVFCWFCSVRFLPYVVLAKILRKKIVIVAGGYDVTDVPEIAYGNMCKKYKFGIPRYLGRIMFRLADKVLCVSESNFHETITNAKVPREKIDIIKHGFADPCEDDPGIVEKASKENMVITVGKIDESNLERKGLLRVAETSKIFPEIPFVFVGTSQEDVRSRLSSKCGKNAQFTGFVDDDTLCRLFLKAKVYLQLSRHEAFGCSVAEAMLFDCIPIVSNKYALPEVVENAGFCVDPGNVEDVAATVDKVLKGELIPAESPRRRVLSAFPLRKRKEKLLSVMEEMFDR